MPNVATAPTHHARSARPAEHTRPECCYCEIVSLLLENVLIKLSAYKSTEKKCWEKQTYLEKSPDLSAIKRRVFHIEHFRALTTLSGVLAHVYGG